MLILLVVQMGTATAPFSFLDTHVKAPLGTDVAMVGMRASCQPIPVLIIDAPAASTCRANSSTSAHVDPPSTRSNIDSR